MKELLNINTCEIDDSKEDMHHNRYEPTPYSILNRLIESEYLTNEHSLLDVGCGKGRVALYLNEKVGCKCKGIDFNQELIDIANKNSEAIQSSVTFECVQAQDYELNDEDCFYFFNPFSVQILKSVMNHILSSYYENPRNMLFFFYYPDDDFMAYLMGIDELICIDEIDCSDLFGNDERERIVVFETI